MPDLPIGGSIMAPSSASEAPGFSMCALAASLVSKGTSGAPGNNVSVFISDGNDRVIECRMDVSDTLRYIAFDLLFTAGGFRGLLCVLSH